MYLLYTTRFQFLHMRKRRKKSTLRRYYIIKPVSIETCGERERGRERVRETKDGQTNKQTDRQTDRYCRKRMIIRRGERESARRITGQTFDFIHKISRPYFPSTDYNLPPYRNKTAVNSRNDHFTRVPYAILYGTHRALSGDKSIGLV